MTRLPALMAEQAVDPGFRAGPLRVCVPAGGRDSRWVTLVAGTATEEPAGCASPSSALWGAGLWT